MSYNFKNVNKFKVMSMLTAALYFYLFISLLLFPESLFAGIRDETFHFLARRASTLMLGFSVLLFLTRNTPPSKVRQAIAFSVAVNMLGFALSSISGLIHGLVGSDFLFAAVIEALIAVIFFSFVISDRGNLKK